MNDLLIEIKERFSHLFGKPELLLACSGGRDSVALFHAFMQLNISFSVAHCNFQLRESESDGDAEFVRDLCSKHNIKLHTKSFETASLKISRESTQMLARRLRYEWFEEVMESESIPYLAVAHHNNDQIESFFIELSRGNGLKGLSGMQVLNGHVFRPMLDVNGKEIEAFVAQNNIEYREDSSNASSNYLRNRFRNEILPLLSEEIEMERVSDAMSKLRDAQTAISFYANKLKLISEGVQERVLLQEVPVQVLIEALTKHGFSIDQVKNLQIAQPGASFKSESHQINVGSEKIMFNELAKNNVNIVLEKDSTLINKITFEINEFIGSKVLKDASSASFDADKLTLPLLVRNWKIGDRFQPYGMKGEKKLSDFFIDLKYNNWEKQNQLIVEDATGKIIWIVGKRISELVKVTPVTKKTIFIVTK